MHFLALYLFFCVLCLAKAKTHYGGGPGGQPSPQPDNNHHDEDHDSHHHDGDSDADDDHNQAKIPKHSFVKRVLKTGAEKKVFVKFVQGPFTSPTFLLVVLK